MPDSTAQRVYFFYRGFQTENDYPPTQAETALALTLNPATVWKALKLLERWRFIERQARKWRGVRALPRFCKCGAEILPDSAVIADNGHGGHYVRRICPHCQSGKLSQWSRNFRAANPGYATRAWQRWKTQTTA